MTARHAPAILNWAGSKARVAKFLCRLNLPEVGTYYEPFLGSGAAYLALASAGLITSSALSDLNTRLVNVFRSVQANPDDVVCGLRLHALLDSDVHFSAVLGRLNAQTTHDVVDGQLASDTIYLLTRSFHSIWYETLDGAISMSRRTQSKPFRPRLQDVVRTSALLRHAAVDRMDFRRALTQVEAGDLVFLDPPYLYGEDRSDQHAYNADRFTASDLRDLITETRRLADCGVHLIFCWGERADALLPDGHWIQIGRDHIWLSDSLVRAVLPPIPISTEDRSSQLAWRATGVIPTLGSDANRRTHRSANLLK
jgi:DNA adenine methylase